MPNPLNELQRARAALEARDSKSASRICQKLLTANPRDLDARYLHGRSLAAMGRWGEAAADFRRVITTRVGFLPAMVDFGIAAALSGNVAEAIVVLQQARVLDSRPAEVHFGLGLCGLAAGDNAAAARSFIDALERNPQSADAYNNLGVAYDRLGRLQDACEAFRRATLLQPGYADAHRNQSDVLRRLGDLPGATAALGRALALKPDDEVFQTEFRALQGQPP